jgi:serine phosphatase RsbU (regulator of sigma subunit)/Tfp pilus assembly protein PilF
LGFEAALVVFEGAGDYARALEYYQRSLKTQEEIGDRAGVAVSLNNIGNIYYNQGDYARALEYYHRSLKIQEEIGNRAGVAGSLGNIGNIYKEQGDYSRALEYYQRSLKIQEEIGDRAGMAMSLNNIGLIYYNQGEYARALEYFQQSLKIRGETGDRAGVANGSSNIGDTYMGLGQLDSARFYARKGLKLAQEVGNMVYKRSGAKTLFQVDSARGDWKGAFEAARLYHIYSDSMKNDEQSKELGRLESRFESEKEITQRDLAITKLEADRLGKDLILKEQKNKSIQDSLANAEQKAILEANSLRLAQQVRERDQQRERDSLQNASIFERLERERVEKQAELDRQRFLLVGAGIGLLLVLVIAYTLFRSRRKEQQANAALRALNEQISQQKAEIEAINSELQVTLDEVNEKKAQIEEQHAKIEDSIRYASRIQEAILPKAEDLQAALPAHFIHFQPRDIVSGDFYWLTRQDGKTFFAAVDCTGHGVPGAFMSVLGSNLLHQIVDENQITEPDVILSELDRRIAATLRQQFGGDSKDGMDLALVVLHAADANGTRIVHYAGAGRPLWHYSQGKIKEYKSAKYACGGSQHEGKTYPAHRIEVQTGDRLYIFSDGPVDQFGGPAGRKLGSTQLQAFLVETASLSIEEQGKAFDVFFNDWMNSKKQLDDVLLAGILT